MEIVDYRVVLNKSVYAEFTIYIPKFDLEIAKCREFRMTGENGFKRWFSFPGYWHETPEQKGFKPYVKFRLNATEQALWDHVRACVDDYLEKHPELDIKPQSFSENNITEMPF